MNYYTEVPYKAGLIVLYSEEHDILCHLKREYTEKTKTNMGNI